MKYYAVELKDAKGRGCEPQANFRFVESVKLPYKSADSTLSPRIHSFGRK